ncbi:MAG: response regulator [Lachnospiraceae bacterium]|jgi:putative two-component system response regulator|nr:response regulator [Lachnospiraceae bacterium]
MQYDDEKKVILVVDDDPNNLKLLQEILKDKYKVYASPSAYRALHFLEKRIPNLILLDIEMPEMNGYEFIQSLKKDYRWAEIPVIFLTASEGRDKEQRAFELGAVDYVLKPISPSVVMARIELHTELQSYKKDLEKMVENKTLQLLKTQDIALELLANVTATRDNETGAHIKRTTIFAELLVNNLMKLSHPKYIVTEDFKENLVKSAKLHDIGKVAIPDNILRKPGKLTADEFNIIKQHTVFGARILDSAIGELGDDSYFLYIARQLVISHHEWWDGTGYPYGLKGEEIPLAGRIMAIADVYDALISKRPYKEPFNHDFAMDIIHRESGTHFDPVLLKLSHEVMEKFYEVAQNYKDENYEMKMLIHNKKGSY